jgi:hypothetical protein
LPGETIETKKTLSYHSQGLSTGYVFLVLNLGVIPRNKNIWGRGSIAPRVLNVNSDESQRPLPPVPTGEQAGWVQEPILPLRKERDRFLATAVNRSPVPRLCTPQHGSYTD